jgi:hypothetical protein
LFRRLRNVSLIALSSFNLFNFKIL